jgi:hypothetical protein
VRHACTAFQLSSMARFRTGSDSKLELALFASNDPLASLRLLSFAPAAAPPAAVGSIAASQAAKPARNSSSEEAGSPTPRLIHKSCKSRRLKVPRAAAPPHSNCRQHMYRISQTRP